MTNKMDPIIVKTEANLEMLVKSEKITSELFAHLKEEIKASIATGVPTDTKALDHPDEDVMTSLAAMLMQTKLCTSTNLFKLDACLALLAQCDQPGKPGMFILFRFLPTELRLKIWRETFPKDRVVILRWDKQKQIGVTTAKHPIAFSICKESRTEAYNAYTLLYGRQDKLPLIYIDLKSDLLYMSERGHRQFKRDRQGKYVDYISRMSKKFVPSIYGNLASFAIDFDIFNSMETSNQDCKLDMHHVAQFTNLTCMALIIERIRKIDNTKDLIQVTWGKCPLHDKRVPLKRVYDENVIHGCEECGNHKIIKDVVALIVDEDAILHGSELARLDWELVCELDHIAGDDWKFPNWKVLTHREKGF